MGIKQLLGLEKRQSKATVDIEAGPEHLVNSEMSNSTELDPETALPSTAPVHPVPLERTETMNKRDAATYGIKYKPERHNNFWAPTQARERHERWLKLLGRIGWAAKGVVYALIGGLACDSAVGDRSRSASPQGAFVLVGTGGRGLLIILAIAIGTYSVWRFWEAAVGQGSDETFSNMKNFFKFRLSPFVSGAVYVAYDILVIELIPKDGQSQQDKLSSSSWPNSWHNSGIGKAGLVLVGIAFLAATVVQLEQFFTKSFHNTIKKTLWRPFRIFVLTCGHIGVLGRAGIFLFSAILFFRTVKETDLNVGKSAFGNALAQLQNNKAGRAALFVMGFFTIVYGLFAVLNMYARIFPTPPPTGTKRKRHYSATGGEAPIVPQFAPGQAGFHPLHGPSFRQPEAEQPGAVELTDHISGAHENENHAPAVGHAEPKKHSFSPMTAALQNGNATHGA